MFRSQCLYGFKLYNQTIVHIHIDYIIAYTISIRIVYGQRFLPLNPIASSYKSVFHGRLIDFL